MFVKVSAASMLSFHFVEMNKKLEDFTMNNVEG